MSELGSGRLTSGALAERLKVTPAVVTGLVDRLERSGFAERVQDREDRRRIWVQITSAGEASLQETDELVSEPIARELSSLTEREMAVIEWSFERLEQVLSRLEQQPTINARRA